MNARHPQSRRHRLACALLCCLTLSAVPAATGAGEAGLIYTGDWLANVGDGGLQRDSRYLDNLQLSLEAPLRLPWLDEGRFFGQLLHNTGKRFSADVLGDAQVVSNIEASRATRLYELYVEGTSPGGGSSLLFGFWDLNSELDVIEPATLFLNSSHGIGAEFGTSGRNGPSIFPVTSLTLRWRRSLSERLTLRAAVMDGVPGDPGDPGRFEVRLSGGGGALLAAELEYRPAPDWVGKVGGWHYTARQAVLNQPQRQAFGNGAYLSLAGTLARGPAGRLEAFLRAGVANGEVQQIDGYLGAGLVATGLAGTRPSDQIGLAFAAAFAGTPSRAAGADRHETSIELTYSAALTPWLRLQPNLQYVVNPGFDPNNADTLVAGIRLEITGTLPL